MPFQGCFWPRVIALLLFRLIIADESLGLYEDRWGFYRADPYGGRVYTICKDPNFTRHEYCGWSPPPPPPEETSSSKQPSSSGRELPSPPRTPLLPSLNAYNNNDRVVLPNIGSYGVSGAGIYGAAASGVSGAGIYGAAASGIYGAAASGLRYPSGYGGAGAFRQVRYRRGTYEIVGFKRDSRYGYNSYSNTKPGYAGGYGGGSLVIDQSRNRERCPYANFDILTGVSPLRQGLRYKRSWEVNNTRRNSRLIFEDDDGQYDGVQYDEEENVEEKGYDVTQKLKVRSPGDRLYFPSGYGGYGAGYGGLYGRGCGRNDCVWEAQLICDIKTNGEDVRWTRVYDLYYPRGKYHDLMDYIGSRGRVDTMTDGRSRFIIYQVLPEDKGIYVCESWDRRNYNFNGVYHNDGHGSGYNDYSNYEYYKDIMEIPFYPYYPQDPRLCI